MNTSINSPSFNLSAEQFSIGWEVWYPFQYKNTDDATLGLDFEIVYEILNETKDSAEECTEASVDPKAATAVAAVAPATAATAPTAATAAVCCAITALLRGPVGLLLKKIVRALHIFIYVYIYLSIYRYKYMYI